MANVPGFTLNAPTNPLIDPGAGAGGNVLPSAPGGPTFQRGYLSQMFHDLKANPFAGGVSINPFGGGSNKEVDPLTGKFGGDETETPRRSAAYRRKLTEMLTEPATADGARNA